jgi:propanol-preferring alcohol dehydrogenase
MRAMVLDKLQSLSKNSTPLRMAELPDPEPARREIRIRVAACGVCHTELDEIEGRTPPPRLPIVLGHEIVGRVDKLGADVSKFREGDRVGVGWIHSSSGEPDENLSPEFRATGRDVNGGYAELMTVGQDYAYPIPDGFSDLQAAPLMCAGAIGYRALKLSRLADGQCLGLTGFGASAHILLQLVKQLFPATGVFVFARDDAARRFALQLGAAWAGDIAQRAPKPLAAVIDTTPAWRPVVEALANLQPGGRLVINAIRKTDADKSALLALRYEDHLWMEREIKSVANITHWDIQEFLTIAGQMSLRPEITVYPLERANEAILDLHQGQAKGAKVLKI